MRLPTLLFALFIAAPASANSIEDALCPTSSVPVAQMASSEKLCRSFVRALHRLPQATADEARAFLTPENLTLMAGMTAAWLGTQGIPVVGQVVDAALLALGVTLLAAQSAALIDSLWRYADRASTAYSHADLDAAADHLAKAIATAGLNVVAFIFTKQAVGNLGPPPRGMPQLRPATARGSSAPARAIETGAPSTLAPALAMTGAPPPSRLEPGASGSRKTPDLEAFERWIQRSPRRPVRGTQDAYRYQQTHAGPEEVLAQGGGKQVWADGPRMDKARLVEAKYVETPEKSPFIDGSKCNEKVRLRIRQEVTAEFQRYAAVIADPATPVVALEVIVNDARAAPFFETLLQALKIPGEVLVKP
jgi:hypothetical protein